MQEAKRAGKFRLFQPNGTILFFYVWRSKTLGDWAICDVRWSEREQFMQFPDRATRRKLTDAMWGRLVTWC